MPGRGEVAVGPAAAWPTAAARRVTGAVGPAADHQAGRPAAAVAGRRLAGPRGARAAASEAAGRQP
ncbi:MAG: hypothetical protein ACLGIO_13655 [Acidimicrobiia bacterium]